MKNEPVSDEQARFSDAEEWDEEELEAAGIGSRMVNYLFDLLGIGLLAFFVGMVMESLGLKDLLVDDNTNMLIGFLIIMTYYSVWEGLTSRTLGKLITGTYVVTDEGLKPSFANILGRTLCRFIPFEALSFIFGSLGFHDRFSHTRVVKNQTVFPKGNTDL